MKRLSVRLVLSHLAVALVAVITTYAVVRLLAPMLFDQSMRLGQGTPGQGGAGMGQGGLRTTVAAAVDQAVLVGAVVGALAAALLGGVLAWRVTRPLEAVRDAARAIARGNYRTDLPQPTTVELADLSADVAHLGRSLDETETRRVRLLGDVAHEMRTPLTVIDATVEGMIDGVVPTDDEQLAIVTGEVRRLRRLSDDLSSLSRADEGRLDLRPAMTDLGRVVSTAAERLRPQAEDAGLTLSVAAESIMADVDGDRMAQVVTNLVGNAIRATPPAGTVAVRLVRAHDRAVLTVADSGRGLAAGDLERIFERFYRVDPRQSDGGSGVGLTIARGIVHAHGGTLNATSSGPGEGACFTADLPLA